MFRKFCYAALAHVCLAIPSYPGDKELSIADCKYANNPEEFLGRQSQIHRQLNQRVRQLQFMAPRSVSASSVPRRNFIDQEIFGKLTDLGVASAPISADSEFLRRIHLDLTGRIPDSSTIRSFLADASPDKRDVMIDRLLASPEYIDRWTLWMGDLLQNTSTLTTAASNRGPRGRNAFYAYIKDAVAQDKSFRTIAAEVITGTGNTFDDASGAADFPLGASTSMGPVQDTYDTMLVKTATMFLGLSSYDCLLCHNGRGHLDQLNLWAKGRSRIEAESMAAFFSRMMFTPAPQNSMNVSDAADGSYLLNTDSGNRPARVGLGGITALTPVYRETGATPTDGNWRAAFAQNMVKDPMFARNLANRIWKQMFGLALVDPVDSLDPSRLDLENPPPDPWSLQATHPVLLEKLAGSLVSQDFRLKSFLRTIVQSSAYQLSSGYGDDWNDSYVTLFARHYARRMDGEEVHDVIASTTGLPGSYTIAGWPAPVQWAMQLPEPVEPSNPADAAVNRFLNTFLRGDRDTQDRSQAGSIQQQLSLMNDPFVLNRLKVARSAKLQAIASLPSDSDVAGELYLTFLSRLPSDSERAYVISLLQKVGSGSGDTSFHPPPDTDPGRFPLIKASASSPATRGAAVEDLAWMCVNKVEFLFSH
jgi:hypothetical protein